MDKSVFAAKLAVINDAVAWDVGGNCDPWNCIDIDPFSIYESPIVEDPLLAQASSHD
jgi:hypothetical protein